MANERLTENERALIRSRIHDPVVCALHDEAKAPKAQMHTLRCPARHVYELEPILLRLASEIARGEL